MPHDADAIIAKHWPSVNACPAPSLLPNRRAARHDTLIQVCCTSCWTRKGPLQQGVSMLSRQKLVLC
jgi:hypothetical protein